MKKKNYSMNFFGSMNGEFNSSPSEYHRKWRNQVGAGRSFVGPWNYAGESPGSVKSKPMFQGPSNSIGKGTYKEPKGFMGPGNTIGKGVSRRENGFISPVDGYKKKTKRKSYDFGYNQAHTEAIGDE